MYNKTDLITPTKATNNGWDFRLTTKTINNIDLCKIKKNLPGAPDNKAK